MRFLGIMYMVMGCIDFFLDRKPVHSAQVIQLVFLGCHLFKEFLSEKESAFGVDIDGVWGDEVLERPADEGFFLRGENDHNFNF